MKKIVLTSLVFSVILLTWCQKSANKEIVSDINPETQILSSAQAEKVCEPFLKYLECALAKTPVAKRAMNEKILLDTKAKLKNETPALIAQQCDTYIQLLNENADKVFKNGCTLEGDTNAKAIEETPSNPEA